MAPQTQHEKQVRETLTRLVQLQRQFAAILSLDMRNNVVGFVKEANLDAFNLTEDEVEVLVGTSALMGQAVLEAQYAYLATLVKAIYVVGLRRGAAREATERNNL